MVQSTQLHPIKDEHEKNLKAEDGEIVESTQFNTLKPMCQKKLVFAKKSLPPKIENDELPEYEKKRLQNIADRQIKIDSLISNFSI